MNACSLCLGDRSGVLSSRTHEAAHDRSRAPLSDETDIAAHDERIPASLDLFGTARLRSRIREMPIENELLETSRPHSDGGRRWKRLAIRRGKTKPVPQQLR